jgi:hypothetical protein
MATVEELRQRVAQLRQRVSGLENELAQTTQRVRHLERAQSEINQRIAAAIENKNSALADTLKAERDQIRNDRRAAEARIEQLDSELSDARSQLYNAEQGLAAADKAPVQSSGQTTQQAQTARDDGATTQTPEPKPAVLSKDGVGDTAEVEPQRTTTVPSNASTNQTAPDGPSGTNDRLRTLEQTQQTPPATAQPGSALGPNSPAANNKNQTVPTDDAAATGRPAGGSTAATPDTANKNTNTGASAAQVASGATARNVQPTSAPGKGAAGDDQLTATQTQINAYFGGRDRAITPQPNVLDRYGSYTYNISIYIMSPADYKKLLDTKQRDISGFQLLMSSGGAPTQVAGTVSATVNPDTGSGQTVGGQVPGRNQFFPLDFYIDDVRLKSVISGKGAQGPHNVFEMTFKITEPNGITFLDNLYAATQDYVAKRGGTEKQNYAAQNFLMVIKFYGYDEYGRAVPLKGSVRKADGSAGPETVIEKYIPFQFTGIKFRIANKLTEYECQAMCPQGAMGLGQGRGTIPYNVEITATTLKELLTGNLTFKSKDTTTTKSASNANTGDAANTGAATTAGTSPTQNQAPPKASAAPNPTMLGGLCDALNRYQKDQVKSGAQSVADIYEIEIVDQVLQDAKIQPPVLPGSPTDWKSTTMTQSQAPADRKDGRKQNANNATKSLSIVAGTNIVRFIDQAVRNSTYIYDQQTKMPTVDKAGNRVDIPQGQPADVLAWYRVGVEAEPLAYDKKRRDYAYAIRYQITMYKVNGVKSEYFPTSRFQGTHKVYNYWFSGQNTSILNLEQDYNYLYYIVVNGPQGSPTGTTNYREYEKRVYATRSNQSDQGQRDSVINEPGANAADYLYSPADQSRVKMTIVGDPAWLQQGEIWSGLQGSNVYSGPFLPDGTINFENQEVLFELAFNKPVDYDSGTGLMDPGRKNYGINRADGEAGSPRQSYIYKAVTVESVFSQGRFTQELEGVLIIFPVAPTQQTVSEEDRQNADNPPNTETRPLTNTAANAASTAQTVGSTPAAPTGTPNESRAQAGSSSVTPATNSQPESQPAPSSANQPPTSGSTDVSSPASEIPKEFVEIETATINGQVFVIQSSYYTESGETLTGIRIDGRESSQGIEPIDVKIQRARDLGPAYAGLVSILVAQKTSLTQQYNSAVNAAKPTTTGNSQTIARDP